MATSALWGAGTAAFRGATGTFTTGSGSVAARRLPSGWCTPKAFVAPVAELPCLACRAGAAERRGTLDSLSPRTSRTDLRSGCRTGLLLWLLHRSGRLSGWFRSGDRRTGRNPWFLDGAGRLSGCFLPDLRSGCRTGLLLWLLLHRSGRLSGWFRSGDSRTGRNPWFLDGAGRLSGWFLRGLRSGCRTGLLLWLLLHRSGRLSGWLRPGLTGTGCSPRLLLHGRATGSLGDPPSSSLIISSEVATRVGPGARSPAILLGNGRSTVSDSHADEPGHASTSPGGRLPW